MLTAFWGFMWRIEQLDFVSRVECIFVSFIRSAVTGIKMSHSCRWQTLMPPVVAFPGFVECCTMLCQKMNLNFLCLKKLYFLRRTNEANAAFQIQLHANIGSLTFTKYHTGGWVDATPHLCGLVENLTVAAVSPSLRPRHLIRRSKFSDEDATRMWSSLPTSHTVSVLAPPAIPTPASPPLSLRTIPQVRLALSVHPPLRSNSLPEATAPSTPPMAKWERVECKTESPNIRFSLLTWTFTDCLLTCTYFIFSQS